MPSGRVWIDFRLILDQLWLSIGCARLSGDFILNAISTITRAETRPNYQKSPWGIFVQKSPVRGILGSAIPFSNRALAPGFSKNPAQKPGFSKPGFSKIWFCETGGTKIGFCEIGWYRNWVLPKPADPQNWVAEARHTQTPKAKQSKKKEDSEARQ